MGPARRIESVQNPVIPIVMDLVRANPKTISFAQGVVAYDPPATVRDSLVDFWKREGCHKYQAVRGIPEFRAEIAKKLATDNSIFISDREALIVTAGGNMAFLNAILAICDPGDEVILLAPFYFNHEMALKMISAVPVVVANSEDFGIDLERVKAAVTSKTRAIVSISPNNPTGMVYSVEVLAELNAFCAKNGLYHISDEAYEYFVYEKATHFSPASISGAGEHTISIFSLSKSFGFAGWRVGYMLAPKHLELSIEKIQDTNLICPPVINQVAAIAALRAGSQFVAKEVAKLSTVRTQVRAALAQISDGCLASDACGAFYLFLRLDSERKPMEVVEQLIATHGVALMPGDAFGAEGCCLRLSYGALAGDLVEEGLDRLVKGLGRVISS